MATARNAQRCMEELRTQGYLPAKVEYYNSFIKRPGGTFGKRIDLYGIIDILAIKPGEILGIQSASSYKDMMEHQRHYLVDTALTFNLIAWLDAGGAFQIWGWEKKRVVGSRKQWHLKTVELRLEDIDAGQITLYRSRKLPAPQEEDEHMNDLKPPAGGKANE